MTFKVFGAMLNLTQSINQSIHVAHKSWHQLHGLASTLCLKWQIISVIWW